MTRIPDSAAAPIRVLLVEDDEDDYLLTRELLEEVEDGRFELQRASTCEAGLQRLSAEPVDVVLLDYQLGGETALDFLARLPLDRRIPPVILLTGTSDRQSDVDAMLLGAADYLVKAEITARSLERAIRYALQKDREKLDLQRQALLFDSMLDAVVVSSLEGVIIDWNRGAERTFGYSRAEVIGRRVEFLDGRREDPAMEAEIWQSLAETGQWAGEVPFRRKDGAARISDAVIVVQRDDRGVPVCHIGVNRDVTERKMAEEALRIASDRARVMADRMRAVAMAAAAMTGAETLDDLSRAVYAACAEAMELDAFTFAQYDPEARELAFLGDFYDGGIYAPPERLPIAGTPSERVILERRSLVTLRADDPASRGAKLYGTARRSESVIRTPILSGERVLGVVSAQSYTPDLYTAEDMEVLDTIAAVASAALANLELTAQRQAATDALKESEERFRLAARATQDLIYDYDIASGSLVWNEAIREVLGHALPGFRCGIAWWEERIHPDDRERVGATLERALAEPVEFWSEEYRFLRADGAYATVLDRGYIVRDALGAPTRMIGSLWDLTEQRRAEEELRSREAELRVVLDHTPDIVARFDRCLRHLYVNPAVELATARTAEEFIGRTNRELGMPEELSAQWEAAIREVFETGWGRTIEFDFPSPTHVQTFQSRLVPEVGADGTVHAVLSIARDITERKRAEEERARLIRDLEMERARLANVFMEAPAFIATVVGPNHVFEMANPQYYQLVGHRELIGRSVREVLPELEGQGFFELLDEVLRTGRPFVGREMPIRLERAPGAPSEQRFVDFVYQPVLDAAGEPTGIFCHGVDVTHQVEARNAVERLAAERGAILRQITDGVMIIDPTGHIAYLNDAAEQLLGPIEPGTPIRTETPHFRMLSMAGEPLAPQELPGARALREQRPITDAEYQIEKPDGRRLQVESSATPVSDESGYPLGAVVAIRDVTDRRLAAARLASAEQHYRRLVENSPIGIYAVDLEARLTEVNPALAQILGRTPEEMIGRLATDYLAPDDREEALASRRARMEDGRDTIDAIYRFPSTNGEERVVQVRAVPIHEDGRLVGSHGVVRDITEERARTERLRLMGHALESIGHGVAIFDESRRIVYANGAFRRMFGLAEELDELPRPRDFFGSAEDAGHFGQIMATVRESGEWTGRVQWSRLGSEVPLTLDLIVGAVVGPDGGPLFLAICSDATELIQKEQQLRRVERLASVGTLLSGVAHELNNPLNSIANFAQLMLMDERDGEDREALDIMQREAERAGKIVSDLRFIARQTQEVDSDKDVVDLNDVVRHVLKIRRYSIETRSIQLIERLAGNLPPLWANRGQMEQVVLNLVLNAEQALVSVPGTRKLEIRTSNGPEGVTLRVTDSGAGIAPEHLNRIFDPFFTTKSPGEGTGLGLSLVHSIVTEHRGEVRVQSTPGTGAVFTIRLPRAHEEPGAAFGMDDLPAPARSLRVLVVDDEPALRLSIARFLQSRSHRVEEAADGADALRRLEAGGFAYDVILSDLRMPGLSGDQLIERLRARSDGLHHRVVFMTGDAASADAARTLEATGSPALIKPVRLEHIARVVEQLGARPLRTPPPA